MHINVGTLCITVRTTSTTQQIPVNNALSISKESCKKSFLNRSGHYIEIRATTVTHCCYHHVETEVGSYSAMTFGQSKASIVWPMAQEGNMPFSNQLSARYSTVHFALPHNVLR